MVHNHVSIAGEPHSVGLDQGESLGRRSQCLLAPNNISEGQSVANAFNKGDVVVLQSGGMPMTVERCPGDPRPNNGFKTSVPMSEYLCVWHRGAQPLSGAYPEHVLERYDNKKKV